MPAATSTDIDRVRALAHEMGHIREDAARLRRSAQRRERGYYDIEDHEAVASILFRFVGCREALWELIRLADPGPSKAEREPVRQFLIAFSAAVHLVHASSSFVREIMQDRQLRDKLNEGFQVYDLPTGTYDRVFQNVTSIDHIQRLKAEWQFFEEERRDATSHLSLLVAQDASCAELVDEIRERFPPAMENIEAILAEASLLLPDVRNRLRHSEIGRIAKSLASEFHDLLYRARGTLFVNVSRLKDPTSALATFSPDQLARVKHTLLPGDIVLTYTAGYMSNLFLPGCFKHGITYVGSTEQRQTAGLVPTQLEGLPEARRGSVTRALECDRLANGEPADVIEAVAEGVIFNSLEHLMTTHVNRMLVLRPHVTDSERIAFLVAVFALLGSRYDFRFDFGESTFQCCTEVIYRSLNGKGQVSFALTPRLGTPTLSADDIVRHHLSTDGAAFETVLLAVNEGAPDATLYAGAEADARLRSLMHEESDV